MKFGRQIGQEYLDCGLCSSGSGTVLCFDFIYGTVSGISRARDCKLAC